MYENVTSCETICFVFIRGYEGFVVICRFDVYDCLNSIVIWTDFLDRYRGNQRKRRANIIDPI